MVDDSFKAVKSLPVREVTLSRKTDGCNEERSPECFAVITVDGPFVSTLIELRRYDSCIKDDIFLQLKLFLNMSKISLEFINALYHMLVTLSLMDQSGNNTGYCSVHVQPSYTSGIDREYMGYWLSTLAPG
jgi:hypothetical protein